MTEKPRHEAFEALRQFVIQVRTSKRLSQRDLAKAAGVSQATVSHLEAGRGTVPKQETLERLARGLGVPYETLDRLARGLPAEPTAREEAEDAFANALYRRSKGVPLSDEAKERVLAILEMEIEQARRKQGEGM